MFDKKLLLLLIPFKIWLYKFLKAKFPQWMGGQLSKLWKGSHLEAKVAIGSVGSADAKLSKGIVSVSVELSYDLGAEIEKKAATLPDGLEKTILMGAVGVLKGLE